MCGIELGTICLENRMSSYLQRHWFGKFSFLNIIDIRWNWTLQIVHYKLCNYKRVQMEMQNI